MRPHLAPIPDADHRSPALAQRLAPRPGAVPLAPAHGAIAQAVLCSRSSPPPRVITHAGVFNQYYTECQVVGSEEEDSRLLLCEATAVIMRQCFHLLGITPLYRI